MTAKPMHSQRDVSGWSMDSSGTASAAKPWQEAPKEDHGLFMSPEELQAMSSTEIKNLLRAMDMQPETFAHKDSMIDALIDKWTQVE